MCCKSVFCVLVDFDSSAASRRIGCALLKCSRMTVMPPVYTNFFLQCLHSTFFSTGAEKKVQTADLFCRKAMTQRRRKRSTDDIVGPCSSCNQNKKQKIVSPRASRSCATNRHASSGSHDMKDRSQKSAIVRLICGSHVIDYFDKLITRLFDRLGVIEWLTTTPYNRFSPNFNPISINTTWQWWI